MKRYAGDFNRFTHFHFVIFAIWHKRLYKTSEIAAYADVSFVQSNCKAFSPTIRIICERFCRIQRRKHLIFKQRSALRVDEANMHHTRRLFHSSPSDTNCYLSFEPTSNCIVWTQMPHPLYRLENWFSCSIDH